VHSVTLFPQPANRTAASRPSAAKAALADQHVDQADANSMTTISTEEYAMAMPNRRPRRARRCRSSHVPFGADEEDDSAHRRHRAHETVHQGGDDCRPQQRQMTRRNVVAGRAQRQRRLVQVLSIWAQGCDTGRTPTGMFGIRNTDEDERGAVIRPAGR